MMEIMIEENIEIWKGCHVLHDFVEMISLKARKTLVDFFEKYPLKYYEFLQVVNSRIKRMSLNCSELYITLACATRKKIQRSEGVQDLSPGLKDELQIKANGRCSIKSKRFQIVFTEAGECIVDYIEKQLFSKFPDINHIILVGEYAQSPILQNIIKTAFSAKNVIIPEEGHLAAVMGAVFVS